MLLTIFTNLKIQLFQTVCWKERFRNIVPFLYNCDYAEWFVFVYLESKITLLVFYGV